MICIYISGWHKSLTCFHLPFPSKNGMSSIPVAWRFHLCFNKLKCGIAKCKKYHFLSNFKALLLMTAEKYMDAITHIYIMRPPLLPACTFYIRESMLYTFPLSFVTAMQNPENQIKSQIIYVFQWEFMQNSEYHWPKNIRLIHKQCLINNTITL